MFVGKTSKRVLSIVMAFVLLVSTCQISQKNVQAADSSIGIDLRKEVTINDVKDSALLAALKTIIMGNAEATMTFMDLTSYTGEIDLTAYASSITGIEGLGYARKASMINLGAVTSITTIPEYEFDSCNMTKVVLPNTVTTIGKAAFKKCTNLTEIDLTNIVSIGDMAFQDCKSLSDVVFNKKLSVLGNDSFNGCSSIQSITIPNANLKLGDGIFAGCEGMESIYIPEGIEEIPVRFLSGTKQLENITIPSTIKTINEHAFYGCGLLSLDLTHCTKLTEIKGYAFAISSLFSIKLPDCVERIAGCAFNASCIYSIELPKSLKSLGESAFANCKYLSTITINDELTAIDVSTFENCESLTKVILSENSKIETIGDMAFTECSGLPGTQFLSSLKKLKSIGAGAFSNCSEVSEMGKDRFGAKENYGDFKEVIIPDSVQSLGEGVFKNSKMIEHAQLGNGITILPDHLFEGCKGLKEVKLPDNLQIIGAYAFASCIELEKIELPETLKEIKDYAFYSCSNYAKIINQEAEKYYVTREDIKDDYNSALKKVYYYVDAENPNNMATIENEYRILKVGYVDPERLMTSEAQNRVAVLVDTGVQGKTEPFITGYEISGLRKVKIPDGVVSIGQYAFSKCYNLQSVELPANLKVLQGDTFSDCRYEVKQLNGKNVPFTYGGLTEVRFKENLQEIGNNAFKNCYNLRLNEGYLPSTLQKIGDSAFENCKKLSYIDVPQDIISIGSRAFSTCGELEEIEIVSDGKVNKIKKVVEGSGLTQINFQNAIKLVSIGNYAFYQTGLTSVTLPQGVKTVEKSTFSGCWYLQRVEIPNSVEVIAENAFSSCYSLRSIIIPSSAKIHSTMLSGYTSAAVNIIIANVMEEIQVPCNGGEVILPLNICNTGSINESGIEIKYIKGNNEDLSYKIVKGNDNVFYVKLIGLKEGSTEIEVKCALKFVNSLTNINCTTNTLTYRVAITKVPCKEITFQKEPYVIAVNNVKGNTITALLNPSNCTDMLEWNVENKEVVRLEPIMVDSNLGQIQSNEAKIVPNALGMSKVTLTAGAVSKSSYVNVVVPASSINVANSKLNLYLGVEPTKQIDTTMKYGTTYTSDMIEKYPDILQYSSENPEIATVDQQGNVTAVGIGTTRITVIALGGYGINTAATKKVITVVVHDKLKNIALANSQSGELYGENSVINVKANQSATLRVITDPVDSAAELIATADDTTMFSNLSVSTSKELSMKVKKLGATYIYVQPKVTNNVGEVQAKIKVNAYSEVRSILLNENRSVGIGLNYSVFKSISTDLGSTSNANSITSYTTDKVVFSSNDPTIAKVDEKTGVVTGGKTGQAKITATWINMSGVSHTVSTTITVERPVATGVSIYGPTTTNVGSTITVTSSLTPVAANNQVTYSVYSGTALQLIDKNKGTFKAVKPGIAKVKVATDNGKTATLSITVKNPAKSIKSKITQVSIKKGASYTISSSAYTVSPTNHTDKMVWSSSNTKVATVNTVGKITGVGKGTAIITGKLNNNVKMAVKVTVLLPATSVKLNKTSVTLNKGKAYTLVATIGPKGTTDRITWKSSNTKVATVNAKGKIVAKSAGTCKIMATTTSGKSASCTVKVKVPATSVKIKTRSASNSTLYMVKGAKYSLARQLNPTTSTDATVWKSSNKKVAIVDVKSGKVTAKANGSCYVTCKATSGKTAKIKIVVVAKAIKSTRVKVTSAKKIYVGKTGQLAVTISKANSTDTLSWGSSNKKIATVDAYGCVKGIRKGTCYITVKTSSGKTAKCKITVK